MGIVLNIWGKVVKVVKIMYLTHYFKVVKIMYCKNNVFPSGPGLKIQKHITKKNLPT